MELINDWQLWVGLTGVVIISLTDRFYCSLINTVDIAGGQWASWPEQEAHAALRHLTLSTTRLWSPLTSSCWRTVKCQTSDPRETGEASCNVPTVQCATSPLSFSLSFALSHRRNHSPFCKMQKSMKWEERGEFSPCWVFFTVWGCDFLSMPWKTMMCVCSVSALWCFTLKSFLPWVYLNDPVTHLWLGQCKDSLTTGW